MTAGTTSARTTGPVHTTGPVRTTGPAAPRRRPGTGLACLLTAGLLWGTGGLTGSLLGRDSGLPALSVAGLPARLGRCADHRLPHGNPQELACGAGRLVRIATIAGLAAMFQGCYFTAVSLTSVSLATLVTIGSAPVLVLAAERVRGRRAGRLAGCATGLALAGLGLLAGLPSGGFPETAVLASAGMAYSPVRGSPRSRWSAPGRWPAWMT